MLGWEDANSTEVDPTTSHPVVIDMPEISRTHMGGTMRLGKRRTVFVKPGSISREHYLLLKIPALHALHALPYLVVCPF